MVVQFTPVVIGVGTAIFLAILGALGGKGITTLVFLALGILAFFLLGPALLFITIPWYVWGIGILLIVFLITNKK